MSSIPSRVLERLRRPLPDLGAYLASQVVSALWRRSLNRAGRGFYVGRGAQLQGGSAINIGDGFHAGQMLWIEAVLQYREFRYEPVIEIGNEVICSQGVHIAATTRVTIHDGVLLGSRVHITDHGHGSYHGLSQAAPDVPPSRRPLAEGRPVVIGRNVWLGDGVVVLPGVSIGEGTIVGANSVVSRNLPARVIAVGAPAVPIKKFDDTSGQWIAIGGPA